jgi:hypothetical protein
MKKYIVRQSGSQSGPLTEPEISERIRAHTISGDAEVASCISSALGITSEFGPIRWEGVFKALIEIQDQELRDIALRLKETEEKLSKQHSPSPLLSLKVKDGDEVLCKKYTVIQIKALFMSGGISACAKFEHPDYPEEWFDCLTLFGEVGSHDPCVVENRWDYYVQCLKISGASSGIISAFTDKGLKEESCVELANLGANGWELVSIVPITTGAIGATWSNSALAFLKRRRG